MGGRPTRNPPNSESRAIIRSDIRESTVPQNEPVPAVRGPETSGRRGRGPGLNARPAAPAAPAGSIVGTAEPS
jgi:hypothetical protein